MDNTAQEKQDIRRQMKAFRKGHGGHSVEAGELASQIFLDTFDFPKGNVVSCYWAVMEEIPTQPLLEDLHEQGYDCCLPVVDESNPSLSFVRWEPRVQMIPSHHGILVPQHSDVLEPDVVVVPLLAFDRTGARLGYGKGYYDRAIQALKATKDILTVGYAYAQQEVDSLPQDQYDQRLDWVVTDKEAIRTKT